MKNIVWEDFPKQKNLFTKRNATMRDLQTNKIIQYYSANTKIAVVQKAQVGNRLFLRTLSAKERNLDWAFEASAFDLPNDIASLVHILSNSLKSVEPAHTPTKPAKKQKGMTKTNQVSPKSEEEKTQKVLKPLRLISKLFKRKKG